MQTRILGKTGLEVSILGVGGYHVGQAKDVTLGVRIVRTAMDLGVTFLDNAWCYNSGVSEWIMGHALRDGYRNRAILMTKNHGRDEVTFRSQLEDSLRRLQTDTIDVLQLHEIINEGDPQKISSQGVLEEAVKAREEGKIRFIGFTGHKWPDLLKQMLNGEFDWDTCQLPTNLLDVHYRSFLSEVVPLLQQRNMGIIGMKSLAGNGKNMFATGVSAAEAMSFSLSLPIHTLISGMDSVEIVQENCRLTEEFEPLSEDARRELIDKVAPHGGDGSLEGYKTD